MKKTVIHCFAFGLCVFNAFAADKEPTGLLPMRGMASVEFGRLEEAFIGPTEQFDKEFLQQASGWLFQDANLSDHFDIHVGLGVMTFSVVDRAVFPMPSSGGWSRFWPKRKGYTP